MSYRNVADGTQDDRQFNLYGYTFALRNDKTVKSVTLPKNRDVVVLAATLTEQYLGNQVNLSSAFNVEGIYTDGTTFSSDGGLDGGGAAYSANLLGNFLGTTGMVVDGVSFNIGAPNVNNAIYGTGTAIPLPAGHFRSLRILGTGVQGDQTSQTILVTYTNGTTQQFVQSFSDWYTPQKYAHESEAAQMAYRDINDGTQNTGPFNLYEYSLPLAREKSVKSLTLPPNRDVLALAVTLMGERPDDGMELGCRNP